MSQQLRVIHDQEQSTQTNDTDDAVPSGFIEDQRSLYERGEELWSVRGEYGREEERFLRALGEDVLEVEGDTLVQEVRVLDELAVDETDDLDLGALLVAPDETLLFLGSDPTAKDTSPLWCLPIRRHKPIPAPESAERAVDLLRPADVQEAFADDDPTRQGEWFLLETELLPVSSTFKPGVQSRPFGPGPLDNHVPREYGFTVTDSEFLEAFEEIAPALPSTIDSVPEVMEWFTRQDRKPFEIDGVPTWSELQECAGDILIRGTLRHRDDDHFVENVGENWHRALTHDMDVFTADSLGIEPRVRLD